MVEAVPAERGPKLIGLLAECNKPSARVSSHELAYEFSSDPSSTLIGSDLDELDL